MTLATTDNRASYSGNDVTTVFAFPYLFFANSDLVVSLITDETSVTVTQVLDTDYTLTGAGTATDGELTMTTAPATGETLLINRSVPYTQDTDYIEGDAFPAETHETALDKVTVLCQQLLDETERTFRFGSAYAGGADPELPDPLPLNYLRWNAGGTELENTTSISSIVASDVPYTATGDIIATDVQAAITELDTDKQALLPDASQAEMEAGTETANRSMSPGRVFEAINYRAGLRVRTDSTTETLSDTASNQITLVTLTGDITKTLPTISATPSGAIFAFQVISNSGTDKMYIVPNASDNIHFADVIDHDVVEMVDVGDYVELCADDVNGVWRVITDRIAGPYFSAIFDGSNNTGTVQSLASGVTAKVRFDTEVTDSHGNFDPTTNYRFTPTMPGWYTIESGIYTQHDGSSRSLMQLYKNGAHYRMGQRTTTTTADRFMQSNWEVYANGSTDYFEVYAMSLDTDGDVDDPSTLVPYFRAKRQKS